MSGRGGREGGWVGGQLEDSGLRAWVRFILASWGSDAVGSRALGSSQAGMRGR